MEKFKFLVLTRREDLVDFFKQGLIFPSSYIQFSSSLESLVKKPKEVLKIFAKIPFIEYSINYFLLYFEAENKSLSKGLKATELISIIPLDEESQRMGLSLSPAVKLDYPIFSDIYQTYQVDSAIDNALKGVENIGSIFGYDDLLKSIKKVSKKHIASWVSLIIDSNSKPSTIWEFLLSYVRNQTYPNGTVGAFLDTMSVVHNFAKGFDDYKDQKNTTTGRLICGLQSAKYKDLIICLSQSPNFVNAANKGYKDFWQIAPLYFILIDLFSKASEDGALIAGRQLDDFVHSVKCNYNETILKPALMLVGITLGQQSTYKLVYSHLKPTIAFLK